MKHNTEFFHMFSKIIAAAVFGIGLTSVAFAQNPAQNQAPNPPAPATGNFAPAAPQTSNGTNSLFGAKYSTGEPRKCSAIDQVPAADSNYVEVGILLPVAAAGAKAQTTTSGKYRFEIAVDPSTFRLPQNDAVKQVYDCSYGASGRATQIQVAYKRLQGSDGDYLGTAIVLTKDQIAQKPAVNVQFGSDSWRGQWSLDGDHPIVTFQKL